MSELELIVKSFHGTNVKVEFFKNEMYFDVSGIANKYNKRLQDWRKLESTKEYFSEVEMSPHQENFKLIRKAGKTVLLHRSVFVNFARWVNVEFAVWSDKLIWDILTGEKILCEKERNQFEHKIEVQRSEIRTLQLNERKTYKDGFMALSKYKAKNNIPLTIETMFDILSKYDIVENRDVTVSKKFLIDETFGRQKGDAVIEFNSRSLDLIFRDYIKVESNLFD